MTKDPAIEKSTEVTLLNRELVLVNSRLIATILPEMGGKMAGLIRKKSGTQIFKQPEIPLEKAELPKYGMDFKLPYASGFDDCFPTVSACTISQGSKVIELPDHGELWSSNWNYEESSYGMKLTAFGKRLKYRFTKWIRLLGDSVQINYEVENLGEAGLPFLWSSHPLLQVDPGDELLLPYEIRDVRVDGMTDKKIGKFGDRLSWQKLKTELLPFDLSVVQPKEAGFAGKFFSDILQTGKAAIYRKRSDESIILEFDTKKIPYLGIWLCYGGWPGESESGDLTVALEPCTGRPDSLEKAIEWKEHQAVAPKEKKSWSLKITVEDGKTTV